MKATIIHEYTDQSPEQVEINFHNPSVGDMPALGVERSLSIIMITLPSRESFDNALEIALGVTEILVRNGGKDVSIHR